MVEGEKKTARPVRSKAVKPPIIEGKVEGAAKRAPSQTKKPVPERARTGWILPGLVVAGLLGGGLGIAGSYGLARLNLWPETRTASQDQLTQTQDQLTLKIDELGQALADLAQKPGPDLSGFAEAGQVGQIREALGALEVSVAQEIGSQKVGLAALGSKLDAVEPAEIDFGPIEAQIASISALVQTLQSDVEQNRALQENAPQQISGDESSENLINAGQLRAQIETLRVENGVLATANNQLKNDLALLGEKVASLASNLASLGENVTGLGDRVEGVAQSIPALEPNSGSEIARLNLALVSIDEALDQGAPFEASFAIVEISGLVPVGDLGSVAVSGAQAPPALVAEFKAMAAELANLTFQDGDNTTTREKLLTKLKSSIGMRPAGMVIGDDSGSVVARIEAYLGQGDLAMAYDEWQNLSEAGRALSQSWADGLKEYNDVRAMVDLVRAAALAQNSADTGMTQ